MPHEHLNPKPPTDGIDDFPNEEHSRQTRAERGLDSQPVTVVPPPPAETAPAAPDLNLRPPADDVDAFIHKPPQPRQGRLDQWDDSLPVAVLPPPPTETTSAVPQLLAAAFLILAVAVGGYFVFRNRAVTTPATTPTAAAASAESPDAVSPLGADVPAIDLPPLDESDEVVRGLVKGLSSHPSVAAWLATDDLVRNFTVVVSNIATGEPAATRVPALKPRTRFQVVERGEDLFIDSASYARYLPLATATTSVNPENAAKLYTMLKPRIEDAYRELGHPETPFDQTLERAIVVLLKTPLPEGRIALEPNGPVLYGFADPALEKLTPSQKLLIRFGPDNQRAVQSSLRNIALALGIPATRLP